MFFLTYPGTDPPFNLAKQLEQNQHLFSAKLDRFRCARKDQKYQTETDLVSVAVPCEIMLEKCLCKRHSNYNSFVAAHTLQFNWDINCSLASISSAHFGLQNFHLSNDCTFLPNRQTEKTCHAVYFWNVNNQSWLLISCYIFFPVRQSYRKWWARGKLRMLWLFPPLLNRLKPKHQSPHRCRYNACRSLPAL